MDNTRGTKGVGRAPRQTRRRGRRAMTLAAVVAMAGSVLAACSSGGASSTSTTSSGAATKSPIVFGAVAAETGTYGAYGKADVDGIKAQIALVNKEGGLLGHKLVLNAIDDQSDASKATVATQQLLASTPTPLVVHAGAVSVDTAAILPLTNRAKVITMTPAATPAFEDPSQNPYTYVVFVSAPQQVDGTAAAIKQFGGDHTKVGILGSNSSGLSISQAMQAGLPKLGLDVVATQLVSDTATDYTAQLQALRSAGAQTVFVQLASPAAFVQVMDNIQTLGWTQVKVTAGVTAIAQPVLTGIPASVQKQFAALGTAPLVRTGGSTSPPGKIDAFLNQLAAVGGNTQLLLESLNGADEVNLLVWAAQHANSVAPDKINAVLDGLGKIGIPSSALYQVPPPAWSSTNHGLEGANFSSYWSLVFPSTPVKGTYTGQVIHLSSSSGTTTTSAG